jgi:hypothetical protein
MSRVYIGLDSMAGEKSISISFLFTLDHEINHEGLHVGFALEDVKLKGFDLWSLRERSMGEFQESWLEVVWIGRTRNWDKQKKFDLEDEEDFGFHIMRYWWMNAKIRRGLLSWILQKIREMILDDEKDQMILEFMLANLNQRKSWDKLQDHTMIKSRNMKSRLRNTIHDSPWFKTRIQRSLVFFQDVCSSKPEFSTRKITKKKPLLFTCQTFPIVTPNQATNLAEESRKVPSLVLLFSTCFSLHWTSTNSHLPV